MFKRMDTKIYKKQDSLTRDDDYLDSPGLRTTSE